MAVVIAIFLAESMLLSLEFKLAKVSFFLPTSSFGGAYALTGSIFTGSGAGCGCVMELMKLLSFCSRSALSFLSSNLGTGGGRFDGLSISL